MDTSIRKRSVIVAGHKTSISLEEEFFNEVKRIASERGLTVSKLIELIDRERKHSNLSSAIRLYILRDYARRLADHEQPPRMMTA